MPALDDSVITKRRGEREDTAAVEAGLDVLEEPDRSATPGAPLGCSVVPPILALVVVLVVWQIVYLLGAQAGVHAAVAGRGLGRAGRACCRAARPRRRSGPACPAGLFGFAMAIVIAVPIGLVVARFNWLRAAIGPLLSGLQSLPSVAWVPRRSSGSRSARR